MPSMSKLSVAVGAVGAGLATTAFVAPAAKSTSTQASSLRGASRGANSSLGLGAAGLSISGLAAMALSRPVAKVQTQVVLNAYDASKEIGACDPLLFWDPIGYCGGDCTKEDFDRRRAVKLKHGRICMFATIGMLWPDIFGKFDGYLSPSQDLKFADVPSGLAAISKVPLEGWLQVLLVAGLIETQLFKDQSLGGFAYGKYGEPGNFGTGYWGRKIQDPAERKLKLTTELNNGRLAMVAMTAMLIQNGLTGQSPVEQLTSGHISPFNDGQGFFAQFDPSKELGACPPLGYWDPFGMMAFQDEEKFRRNRELELKHGRICMAATIGMIVPDLFGRFGGYLSPSMDLKFSDVPCTIEAIYKVPTAGWLQIFALAGAIEAKNIAFPTNYGYPPFWGQINKLSPEEKEKKLLAEINNGRLAMVAMAAIVAQNGATGQSLVEQFTTGNLNPFIGGYAKQETDRMVLRANSEALPWAPVPEGLTNDIFGPYVGDAGFDPAGFAKNQRLLPWPAEDEKLPKELPLALVTAVVVDAAVDGMLIGLSYAASPSAGWAMAIATCIEMGFLGLSFTASLQNATRTAWKIITVACIPPVVLLLAGLGGNSLGYMFSESPGTFVAFISFAIVALLFLVTQELLTEAQSVANGSVVINALFFVGLLCGILLEAYIG